MAVPEASLHPNPSAPTAICRTCLTRDCCRRRVPLTLPELARIARTLALPAARFAELGPPVAPTPTPIRTSPTSQTQVLLRHVDSACIFLLHLGSGRRFCGLGPLAPSACTHFPGPRDLHHGMAPPCPHPWQAPLSPPPTPEHDRLVAAWDALLEPADTSPPESFVLDALLALTP